MSILSKIAFQLNESNINILKDHNPSQWNEMIEELKDRWGTSGNKKNVSNPIWSISKEEMVKTPEQGFFFFLNYNKENYYESQESFFWFGDFVFKNSVLNTHPKDYVSGHTFAVDFNKKEITIEKEWDENCSRLKLKLIDKLGFVQEAVRLAVSRHPELSSYKITGTKIKVKSVKDFLNLDSENDIGHKSFINGYWGTTAHKLRQLMKGSLSSGVGFSIRFDPYYAKQEAKLESDNNTSEGGEAIIYLKLPGDASNWNTKSWSGSDFVSTLKKEYILDYKIDENQAAETTGYREEYKNGELLWRWKYSEIIIADGDEFDLIYNSGKSAVKNRFSSEVKALNIIDDGIYEIGRKEKFPILLINKKNYNEKTLWIDLIKNGILRNVFTPLSEEFKENTKFILDFIPEELQIAEILMVFKDAGRLAFDEYRNAEILLLMIK